MAEAPLSSQNAESGVVVEFVPSTALPSIPGGLRTVGLIGKGSVSKTQLDVTATRGGVLHGIDLLSPKALSLPSTITDVNLVQYSNGLDYQTSLPQSISAAGPSTDVSAGPNDSIDVNINNDGTKSITLTGLGGLSTGVLIAAEIQARVRALTATTPTNQAAYDSFTAVFVNSLYTLTSGTTPLGTVIVTISESTAAESSVA